MKKTRCDSSFATQSRQVPRAMRKWVAMMDGWWLAGNPSDSGRPSRRAAAEDGLIAVPHPGLNLKMLG